MRGGNRRMLPAFALLLLCFVVVFYETANTLSSTQRDTLRKGKVAGRGPEPSALALRDSHAAAVEYSSRSTPSAAEVSERPEPERSAATDPDHGTIEVFSDDYTSPPARAPTGRSNAVVVYLASKRDTNFHFPDLATVPRLKILAVSLKFLDRHLNDECHYPVIIFHEDLNEDDMRFLLKQTRSRVRFYSVDFTGKKEPLPDGITPDQVYRWEHGLDGGVRGRPLGYRMMCRFWSGVVQNHPALRPYDYYLRLDDDNFITGNVFSEGGGDIFSKMVEENVEYVYRCINRDHWGSERLTITIRKFLEENPEISADVATSHKFWSEEGATGQAPYNNMHVSSLSMWRSSRFRALFDLLEEDKLFLKYRVGDALAHGLITTLLARPGGVRLTDEWSYQHNFHLLNSHLRDFIFHPQANWWVQEANALDWSPQ